jgi:hypothetical protein
MLNLYAGVMRRCDLTLLLGLSVDVRFGSKADMCSAKRHVRFTPDSGHSGDDLWPKKKAPSRGRLVR